MDRFWTDLRYGVRMLRKRPGTSMLAIVALALGIGLTTTMFSIVDAAFLRGMPFDRAQELVYVATVNPKQTAVGGERLGGPTWLHNYVDWRARQHAFEDLAAYQGDSATLSSDELTPVRYSAARLTPNLLPLLRVAPIAGRGFRDADSGHGAAPVALISGAVWQQTFGGDRGVVGRVVRINGAPTTIVGVLPAGFGFPERADVWLPLSLELPAKRGDGEAIDVIGRLRPGVSVGAAGLEMAGIARQLADVYPENKDLTAKVVPIMTRFLAARIVAVLSTMLAAVTGVLLIACANVMNLQLARGAERLREIGVRLSLGASRGTIVRQLIVEGGLIAAIGAALGVGLAAFGSAAFMRGIANTEPPFWIVASINVRVLTFVLAVTVVAVLASSLVPALRLSRTDVNAVLKDEGRATTSLRIGRLSRGLVMAEMTLSFCLLVVSGLMVRTVLTVSTVRYPFRVDRTLIARTALPSDRYPTADAQRLAASRLQDQIAAIPGVQTATVSTDVPGGGQRLPVTLYGQPPADAGSNRQAALRIAVAPNYFDVLNVRVLSGRAFTTADRDGAPPVAVVSADFVRRFYPRDNPIGQRIQLGRDPKSAWWTIVGVAPELAVMIDPARGAETVYVPFAQAPQANVFALAATGADPTTVAQAVRRAAQSVDRDLPVFDVMTLRQGYDQQTWPFRVFGGLFTTFGFAALVLAAAGLYGVMAFAVRRRTQEIGVRMALGATRAGIIRMIVRQGLVQTAVGMTIGLLLGRLLAGQLTLLLFRVSPFDPLVFGTTIAVLGGVGLMASLVPARRAASVDPLTALRRE